MNKNKDKDKNNENLFFKYFLRDNILFEILESRSLKFYKKRYNLQTSISLFLSIFIFIFSTIGHYSIIKKNENQKKFITTTLGQTKEYIQTESRINTIRETLQYQQQRR